MEFCPRLPQKKAFDLVERVRGLRMPVFGKRAPRLGAGQKFGFRPGRKCPGLAGARLWKTCTAPWRGAEMRFSTRSKSLCGQVENCAFA